MLLDVIQTLMRAKTIYWKRIRSLSFTKFLLITQSHSKNYLHSTHWCWEQLVCFKDISQNFIFIDSLSQAMLLGILAKRWQQTCTSTLLKVIVEHSLQTVLSVTPNRLSNLEIHYEENPSHTVRNICGLQIVYCNHHVFHHLSSFQEKHDLEYWGTNILLQIQVCIHIMRTAFNGRECAHTSTWSWLLSTAAIAKKLCYPLYQYTLHSGS